MDEDEFDLSCFAGMEREEEEEEPEEPEEPEDPEEYEEDNRRRGPLELTKQWLEETYLGLPVTWTESTDGVFFANYVYDLSGNFPKCIFSSLSDCEPYWILCTTKGVLLQKCKNKACDGSRKGVAKCIMNMKRILETGHRQSINATIDNTQEHATSILKKLKSGEVTKPDDFTVNTYLDAVNEFIYDNFALSNLDTRIRSETITLLNENNAKFLETHKTAEAIIYFPPIFDALYFGYINKFLCVIVKHSKPTFIETYDNETVYRDLVNLNTAFRSQPWLTDWINSPMRQEYDDVTFDPRTTLSGKNFNLFTGLAFPKEDDVPFSTEAMTAAVQPVLDHILNIWCRGDVDLFDYTVNWMSHIVRWPWIRCGTALVLRSSEGGGKGVIVDLLAEVIGKSYYYQVLDAEHSIFGRFTPKNFGKCLLMFGDEITFGGSHSQSGKLKKMVTESTHELETKYGARITIPNHMNIIFASNNDWVIPVGMTGRRWVCLDLANTYAGRGTTNHEYFQKILSVKPAEFARYLHNVRDLDHFRPRNVPTSTMLRDQKELRFCPITAFWSDALRGEDTLEWYDPEKQISGCANNLQMYDMYKDFCKTMSHSRQQNSGNFFKKLRTLCTFRNEGRLRLQKLGQERQYYTLLPTLQEARDEFCIRVDDENWFKNI